MTKPIIVFYKVRDVNDLTALFSETDVLHTNIVIAINDDETKFSVFKDRYRPKKEWLRDESIDKLAKYLFPENIKETGG